jgi:nucleoside-diphosphate-sugar epimerase
MDTVNLTGQKILVTGGNGYLGYNFIKRLLDQKAFVSVIDVSPNATDLNIGYYQVDLSEEKTIKQVVHEINPDYIFHLAALLNRSRDFSICNDLIEANLIGTINLLNAIKDIDYTNLIYISSSEVYGNENQSPFKENMLVSPTSPYSLSKYFGEKAVSTFSNIQSKNFTILRLFNFFGKDMPKNFFLSQLIDKLKNNENFDMTKGEQKRDFLHVLDVIDAMILAVNKRSYNQIFNVCSGEGKTLKELAIEAKELLNSKSEINFGAIPYRKNEIWEMIGDNTKIRFKLGWKTKKKAFLDI